MHPSVARTDIGREGFDVSSQQLAEPAVVKDGSYDGAAVRQLAERLFVGGPVAFFGLARLWVEFEFLDVVEYEGEEYIVLIENDEDADEVVILKINPIDEETEEYVSIDDDALLDTVFEKFKKKYEGDINFA